MFLSAWFPQQCVLIKGWECVNIARWGKATILVQFGCIFTLIWKFGNISHPDAVDGKTHPETDWLTDWHWVLGKLALYCSVHICEDAVNFLGIQVTPGLLPSVVLTSIVSILGLLYFDPFQKCCWHLALFCILYNKNSFLLHSSGDGPLFPGSFPWWRATE